MFLAAALLRYLLERWISRLALCGEAQGLLEMITPGFHLIRFWFNSPRMGPGHGVIFFFFLISQVIAWGARVKNQLSINMCVSVYIGTGVCMCVSMNTCLCVVY